MKINELAKELAEEAKILFGESWADNDPIALHMLMVSEIAEATEQVRKGKPQSYVENGKPEGEAIELADCVMRILNYCAIKGIDLEVAIQTKRDYNNKKRQWKTEGKRI